MTYECEPCGIRWWPYHTRDTDNACPQCGGGTKRKMAPASEEAEETWKAILRARRTREEAEARLEHFLAFYEQWDRDSARAQRVATAGTVDWLIALYAMPDAAPDRRLGFPSPVSGSRVAGAKPSHEERTT